MSGPLTAIAGTGSLCTFHPSRPPALHSSVPQGSAINKRILYPILDVPLGLVHLRSCPSAPVLLPGSFPAASDGPGWRPETRAPPIVPVTHHVSVSFAQAEQETISSWQVVAQALHLVLRILKHRPIPAVVEGCSSHYLVAATLSGLAAGPELPSIPLLWPPSLSGVSTTPSLRPMSRRRGPGGRSVPLAEAQGRPELG